MANGTRLADIGGMDPWEKIAERLLAFQVGLEKSGAEICRTIEVAENSWIQWTSPKYGRIIPPEHAAKLCSNYELTMDWIYRGLAASRIPDHIREKLLRKAESKRRKAARK